MNSVGSE